MLIRFLLACGLLCAAERPRILVLTDISSLTAGVREPDDGQSLVRFLLLANEYDIEGIVASSNMGHGQVVRPELVREAIDAYAKDFPQLRKHDQKYPEPESLRRLVKAGQPVAGPKVEPEMSYGEGKDTEGSQWIIAAGDREDKRPLWILIWGGSADLAQALWRVRQDRSPADAARFIKKLRVHSIYHQDSTGAVLEQEWPDLFYMVRNHGIRGMYRGGDVSLSNAAWVKRNVTEGKGALGALYPNYSGGDIWSSRLGKVLGVKEGDTPSFLFLFPNGLNDPEQPELGGWGGRMEAQSRGRLRWEDAVDRDAPLSDPDRRMMAVHRWRVDFQNEMAARLDWTVKEPGEANHAPVAEVKGFARRTFKAGEWVMLDASGSSDPDGDKLDYEWMIYPASPGVEIKDLGRGKARVTAIVKGHVNVVVRVRDQGVPALSRYARVMLNVTR